MSKYTWKKITIPKNVPTTTCKTHDPDSVKLDPSCFFLIKIEDGHIEVGVVKDFTMTHKYTGTNAQDMYRTIIEANEISQLDHAAYLGHELARAEQCLTTKQKYVQS